MCMCRIWLCIYAYMLDMSHRKISRCSPPPGWKGLSSNSLSLQNPRCRSSGNRSRCPSRGWSSAPPRCSTRRRCWTPCGWTDGLDGFHFIRAEKPFSLDYAPVGGFYISLCTCGLVGRLIGRTQGATFRPCGCGNPGLNYYILQWIIIISIISSSPCSMTMIWKPFEWVWQ